MLLNAARVAAFMASNLLRKNWHGGKNTPPPPYTHPPRLWLNLRDNHCYQDYNELQ